MKRIWNYIQFLVWNFVYGALATGASIGIYVLVDKISRGHLSDF